MAHLAESIIEQAALAWPANLGYLILFDPDIASDMPTAERDKHWQVMIADLRKKNTFARRDLWLGSRISSPTRPNRLNRLFFNMRKQVDQENQLRAE